jgi:hypothetical protein
VILLILRISGVRRVVSHWRDWLKRKVLHRDSNVRASAQFSADV